MNVNKSQIQNSSTISDDDFLASCSNNLWDKPAAKFALKKIEAAIALEVK